MEISRDGQHSLSDSDLAAYDVLMRDRNRLREEVARLTAELRDAAPPKPDLPGLGTPHLTLMHVAGRLLTRPMVRLVAHADYLALLIDDQRDPEQWVHVTLPLDRILDAIEEMVEQHPTDSANLGMVVQALRDAWAT
jgi:hypothetical protein